ncbi:hypothetical protein U1Q18_025535 [Sarracenia purpurea var. burkii]
MTARGWACNYSVYITGTGDRGGTPSGASFTWFDTVIWSQAWPRYRHHRCPWRPPGLPILPLSLLLGFLLLHLLPCLALPRTT